MNWTLIIFSALVGIVAAIVIYMRSTMKKSVTFLSEADFAGGMRKAQLIDIRKRTDFEEGHINGARNIPVGALNKMYNRLRLDQPLYLVCAEGKTCKRASVLLASKGFTDIFALEGGMTSWTKPLKVKK